MSKKVYIFLADGFEDIEGLTVVDLLRRAGIDIKTVSIKETKQIQTSHGITMLTDTTLKQTSQMPTCLSSREECREPNILQDTNHLQTF